MKTNFEIEENYAVQLNGTRIDPHYNFDFVGLAKHEKNIIADFKQTNGDPVMVFGDGRVIRIGCDEMELTVEK